VTNTIRGTPEKSDRSYMLKLDRGSTAKKEELRK